MLIPMKDCCRTDETPKPAWKRLLGKISTAIILTLLLGGVLFTILHALRG